MKKYLAMLLAGVMACSVLTGCGKEANDTDNSDASAQSSEVQDTGSGEDLTQAGDTGLEIDFDNLSTKSLSNFNAADYVTLGEYEGVDVDVVLEEITEEKISEYVENIKSSNPPMVDITDRPVQNGDTANIDYEGKYADTKEAFDGGTAQGYDLVIGSGSFIAGFEDGLVGAEVGQTLELNLKFPDEYHSADLAGKDVIFTVTVNSIKAPADDVTDEWAAGLGYEGVSSLEELNAYAEKMLKESAQQTFDQSVESAVIQKVTDNSSFADMPEELVNWYMKQQYEMIGYTATMYSYYYGQQLSASDIISIYMQNEGFVGTAEDYLKDISTDMTNQYVMFKAIADEQGIVVSDEDVDTYLKNVYDNASTTAYSSYEEYKENIDIELYREMLMAEEVVKFLVDKANVVSDNSGAASSAEETTEASAETTSK
jgi:trigger factor